MAKRIYKTDSYIIHDNDGAITPISIRDSRYNVNAKGYYVYDTAAEARTSFFVPLAEIGDFLDLETGGAFWTDSTFTEFLNTETSSRSFFFEGSVDANIVGSISSDGENIIVYLQKLLTEQKETNKLLKKIAN